MRVKLLPAVLAASLVAHLVASLAVVAPAAAQTTGGEAAAANTADVPRVTIINRSSEAPAAAPASPATAASPAAPSAPGAPASPASPAAASAVAAPEVPGAPATPAGAASPASPSAPGSPATAAAPQAPQAAASPTQASSPQASPASSPPAVDAGPKAAAATGENAAEPPAGEVVEAPPPEPTLAINIDLTRQMMTVSESGHAKFAWPVSSARYGYRTPTGTFHPAWMSKMWYSRQYDYAPMPNAIFFDKGVAIHGSSATAMLGRPASHGCVRLAPKNAATLFRLVTAHGKARTQIVVHGTPDHSSARIAAQDRSERDETIYYRRGSGAYGYLPPDYYGRRRASAYDQPYYYAPRNRRGYYVQQRRYQPRGLYNGYSYGYGF